MGVFLLYEVIKMKNKTYSMKPKRTTANEIKLALVDLAEMANNIGSDTVEMDIGEVDGIKMIAEVTFHYVKSKH